MGKITEIIKSGVAPGIRAGRPAVDPDSVFAKVPKALREIERGERRSKRGTDAKDISRLFGMSTSTIKAAWNIGCVLALFLTQCGAFGGDLQPGETFTDGQTVHASDLNNAIGGATLNSGSENFISRQPPLTPNVAADYFIGYNPSVPGLYKATLVSMLQNPYAFQSLTPGTPIYTNQDLFQFYSASQTNLESINPSNLVLFVAQNINLPLWANLNLAPTNNNTGATNLPVLANWPYTFSGAQTNNQPFLLTWGSNGVPYQLSLSNTEKNIASDFGTNLLLPYEFSQEFAPWSLYGTNAGFTNAWGYQTNFPITALFLPATNTPTLTDTDTVPIFSGPQQTNTTASLLSIYEYMTNKNALPPYTIARIQFSGFPASISVSNTANTSQSLIQVATNSFPAAYGPPYAVDIITNGSQAFWTGIQTNTIYYVVPQATNNMWLTVYSNYTDAAFSAANYRTNQIPIIATGNGALDTLLYLTNYTSFNADVIQVITPPTTIRTAVYDVYFRTTSSQTPYYYVTSKSMETGTANNGSIVNFSGDNIITTNKFRIATIRDDGSMINSPLIQVLVNPQ